MTKLAIEDFLTEAFKRNKSAQTHKEVHARAVELIRRCWKEDVFIVFTDGLRTNIDQAALYGKGRRSYIYNGKQYGNPKVSRVTNAQPGSSMHNYGLALDFVTCDGYGKNIDWVVGPKWRRAAAIAKELGFEWGGDWKSFYDAPHIEYNGGLSMARIRAGEFPTFKSFTPVSLSDFKASTAKTNVNNKIGYSNADGATAFRIQSGKYTSREDAVKAAQDVIASGKFGYVTIIGYKE